jgi:hypothetical protein
MSDETAPAHETSGSTRTADASDMQTAKDWFKSVFKINMRSSSKHRPTVDKLQKIAALTDRSPFLLIKPAPPALAG